MPETAELAEFIFGNQTMHIETKRHRNSTQLEVFVAT